MPTLHLLGTPPAPPNSRSASGGEFFCRRAFFLVRPRRPAEIPNSVASLELRYFRIGQSNGGRHENVRKCHAA